MKEEYTTFLLENKTKYKINWYIKGININYINAPKIIEKEKREEIIKKSNQIFIGNILKILLLMISYIIIN
jgi:hypothetical protein